MASETPNPHEEQQEPVRDWGEMPEDVLSLIFLKLGFIDILVSAQSVCSSWRKLSKQPHLFRSIHMPPTEAWSASSVEGLVREAVDRSSGDLTEASLRVFATDDMLTYLIQKSGSLRRLQLVYCRDITDDGFLRMADGAPQLEELEICHCDVSKQVVEAIGRMCPFLKSFRLNYGLQWHISSRAIEEAVWNEEAMVIAQNMHELRCLDLFGNMITDDGLRAILNGCPYLQFLDLRRCFSLRLEGDLKRRCADANIKLRLPKDPTDDYEFDIEDSFWRSDNEDYDSDDSYLYNNFVMDDDDLLDEEEENDDDDDLLDEEEEEDFGDLLGEQEDSEVDTCSLNHYEEFEDDEYGSLDDGEDFGFNNGSLGELGLQDVYADNDILLDEQEDFGDDNGSLAEQGLQEDYATDNDILLEQEDFGDDNGSLAEQGLQEDYATDNDTLLDEQEDNEVDNGSLVDEDNWECMSVDEEDDGDDNGSPDTQDDYEVHDGFDDDQEDIGVDDGIPDDLEEDCEIDKGDCDGEGELEVDNGIPDDLEEDCEIDEGDCDGEGELEVDNGIADNEEDYENDNANYSDEEDGGFDDEFDDEDDYGFDDGFSDDD